MDELPPERLVVVIVGPYGDALGYRLDDRWWKCLDGEDEPDPEVWEWREEEPS